MSSYTSMLLALALGTLIPALTAFVTKLHASRRLKTMLGSMLAALAGGLTGAYTTPPQGLAQWEQIGISILLAWVAAGVGFAVGTPGNAAMNAVANKTPRFGVGRSEVTGV